MRFPSLVTGILLVVFGAPAARATPPTTPRLLRPAPVAEAEGERRTRGHVRRGDGFTVWEETREEADAWAEELAAAAAHHATRAR